jgi:hypothetical protein
MPELLPPLFQRWIERMIPEGIPSETRATCDSCTMLPRPAGEPENEVNFNPATKCCTYHPELHNFVAGNVLLDESPEGYAARRTIERRIAMRGGVSPLAVSAPAIWLTLYNNAANGGIDVFGRSETLKCPYYIDHGGRCGIWRHRESVCSTFFCKHSRGAAGRQFWRGMASYLGQLEAAVRVWALHQIDPGGGLAMANLNLENRKPKGIDEAGLAGRLPPGLYEVMWGSWAGREIELYKRCAEAVNALSWEQVLAIGGEGGHIGARTLAEMARRLRNLEAGQRLTRGAGYIIKLGRRPGEMRLKNHVSPYDFVDVPVAALTAATRIADRPLAEARAELAAEGLDLDDESLRWLIDFEVLVPARP